MSIKLKALGLGLLAVLAISAMSVLNASATTGGHFTSEVEHTILKGTEGEDPEGSEFHWTIFYNEKLADQIHCDETTYSGTVNSAIKTVEQVTITPEYKKCTTVKENKEVEVTMNGCDYLFTIGKKAIGDNTIHITCPAGKKIQAHVGGAFCTIEVGPQTVAGGVSYKTSGAAGKTHAITAEITASKIIYEFHGFCLLLYNTGPFNDLELKGSVTIKGENTAGEQVGITATGSEDKA